jgi:hypothetical protein
VEGAPIVRQVEQRREYSRGKDHHEYMMDVAAI